MWSPPVVLAEWENDQDSLNQWDAMRISFNRMILRHVNLWGGKTLMFLCDSQWFSANLSDLQTILKWFSSESWWISMICKPYWNGSQANLSNSWTILKWFWSKSKQFMNHSEMILEQISVIHDPFWNDSWVNLGGSWTILKWFSSES